MTSATLRSLLVAGLVLGATPTMAQSMADIHAQARERGLTCMTDHYHYGSSSGKNTKRAAEAGAIESWVNFVDLEYGAAWTSWKRSGSKTVNCTNGGAGNWGCDVSSRPCRR